MVVVFVPDSMSKAANIRIRGWAPIVTFDYCNRVSRHKFTAQRTVFFLCGAIDRGAVLPLLRLTTAKPSLASHVAHLVSRDRRSLQSQAIGWRADSTRRSPSVRGGEPDTDAPTRCAYLISGRRPGGRDRGV